MTYETDDGAVRAEGIAALGRMLNHLHLGWAVLGWLLVVPGLRWFVQLCADAFGAGPRDIPQLPRAATGRRAAGRRHGGRPTGADPCRRRVRTFLTTR
ncbi:hypothetical protein O1L44_00920 [Streptomyces noursei]|nr:hypothetical protein [Streptomyces noursei]